MKKNLRVFLIVFVASMLSCYFNASCGGDGATPPEPTTSVGGDGTMPSEHPTVTATTLAKVLTTGGISLTFSTKMDEASVESSFQVTGSETVPGTFTWSENTMTFRPDARWRTNHLYTLTIGTAATDAEGAPFAEAFTQTFKPELNMHDVNGDGMDDFMMGAVGYDYDATQTNAGAAYLFLGKESWSDVDLASQTTDAAFLFAFKDIYFGLDAKVVGDINGDGYADMVIASPAGPSFIVIIYGSASPANVTIKSDDFSGIDGIARGIENHSYLGWPIIPAGDVNGDGLADFLLGSRIVSTGDTRVWLVLGRTDAFPIPPMPVLDPIALPAIDTIADASFSVFGDTVLAGFPVAACDVNGDELNDMIIGSPKSAGGGAERGQVFVINGSESPVGVDLRANPADITLTGAADNDWLGLQVACGDIDNDGFGDVIASAPNAASAKGVVYAALGSADMPDYNFATDAPAAKYTGSTAPDRIGLTLCIPGDVNNDGFRDIMLGSPFMVVEGYSIRGSAYLFLGAETQVSVDLSAGQTANAQYIGAIPPGGFTALGFCLPVGDVNADGIDDMVLGSPGVNNGRGRSYLIFGSSLAPESHNFETQRSDVIFTGTADEDFLNVGQTILP